MILVTGAKGQLGRCLADILGADKAYFCDVEEMDITDPLSIANYVKDKQITAIINCAAYTNVDKAEDEPDKAFAINALGAENLAKTAAELGAALIHISTDYVFGAQSARGLLGEDSPIAPLGIYGGSKLAGEQAVQRHAGSYVIIRTAWLYSPYGHNFLKTVLRVAGAGQQMRVVADQIGTPTYAPDLAAVILKIIAAGAAGKREIYHFSNEGVCSWYDFAHEIARQQGLGGVITPIKTGEYPAKAGRPFFSAMDKSKIKKDYNMEIDHWTIGVQKCLKKLS